MAKISGVNICEICRAEYKWEYVIPQRISTSFVVVEKKDKTFVYPRQTNLHNTEVFEFECRSPSCDKLNRFTHSS